MRWKHLLLAALLGLGVTVPASAAVLNVPGTYPTIHAAVAAAAPGDVVDVAAGTYVFASTLNVNVANLTIQGAGAGATVVRVAQAVGYAFSITAAGVTLQDFTIEKTDVTGVHNMNFVNANNVTIQDLEVFGPDPGTPWSVNGIVSRAFEVAGSLSGLVITNNVIHHLRQPAYINPGTVGTISNNVVYGTRGWVNDGAQLAFTGNSWGAAGNQGADIALLVSVNPLWYPSLLALSGANSDAYVSAQFAGGANGRAVSRVDAAAAPGGNGHPGAPYALVQDGVNNTLAGGSVAVANGTYTEQVVVDGKNLTIDGASRAGTIIRSPLSLTQFFTTSGLNNFPVVFLKNAADIRLQDLTVDGAGRGNANYRFQGVAFWNAGGKLLNADVRNIQDTPFSGAQHGVAVYANSSGGGPYAVEVGDVAITDFQKNAMVMNGAALTADLHDLAIVGKGATGVTAQNGIQVSFGANATITDCAISDIAYSGATWTAAGMLMYDAATVNVTGGSVTNCQFGPYYYDTDGAVSGLSISAAASVGIGTWGAGLYNSTAGPGANLVEGAGSARLRPPVQPMDEGGAATIGLEATLSSLGVSFTGGCVTGPGAAGTYGIDVWSAGGPLTATIANNEVSNWDTGVWVGGAGVAATTEDNAIAGNLTAGYEGEAGNTHDAENNWWGDAAGPAGAGDDVVGATVDYAPWTITGADQNPGCGFTPAADNAVVPGPAPSCISTATPCISVPVSIARSSSDAMRGFSMNVTLSGNLALCGAIAEGTYLSSVGGTNFQVLSLGGGAYTVDAAILGLPCGATAAGGLLFTLPLTSVAPSGTGTVTISSVILRDCDNLPIAGSAGAPLSLTIDNTAPAAVAGLAAAQVKTGNDADGTTEITVSWPAVEAGATVKVYRAGFGNYPEYDDAPGAGSAPAVPAYPPGGPWALAANVSGPSSFADEVAARDFWYYVAFVQDACGNVSAVSNRTAGTLNYHLGDTHDGVTSCAGNNLVNTSDVSFFGANYGIALGVSDPLGCLDVGPTTDFSVNARPTTDNVIQFEDLMMFAINYGVVSAPQMAASPVTTATRSTVSLGVPALPPVGETFAAALRIESAGDVQGVTVQLDWNRDVLEFVAVEHGGMLAAQRGPALALSARPGNVDVAVFGTGVALAGSGEAARAVFRVKAAGEAGLAIRAAEGRDMQNRVVPLDGSAPAGVAPVAASHTGLGVAFPNPFSDQLAIQWSLRRAAPVKLGVFDVTGRRVASLLNGVMEPGQRIERWNGTDDRGVKLAPGYYVLRLEAGDVVQTRTIRLIH